MSPNSIRLNRSYNIDDRMYYYNAVLLKTTIFPTFPTVFIHNDFTPQRLTRTRTHSLDMAVVLEIVCALCVVGLVWHGMAYLRLAIPTFTCVYFVCFGGLRRLAWLLVRFASTMCGDDEAPRMVYFIPPPNSKIVANCVMAYSLLSQFSIGFYVQWSGMLVESWFGGAGGFVPVLNNER